MLGLAIAMLAVVASGCEGGLGDRPGAAAPEAKPAPPIDVPRLEGSGRYSNASLKGKVTLVNFWASWCPPCRSEMPAIATFARAHPEIRVLGLAVSDKPSNAIAFAKKVNVGYELGADRDGSLSAKFGVPGLPATFVLDSRGDVARSSFGEVNAEELAGLIEGVT
jgi:cytochrome c biogenesis protein CcmG, thiol:disulfide interchange protein DsbE